MSSMKTSISRTDAWISGDQSVTIAISDQISMTGVLDMAKVLEGFALRLRELRKKKEFVSNGVRPIGRAALHPYRTF